MVNQNPKTPEEIEAWVNEFPRHNTDEKGRYYYNRCRANGIEVLVEDNPEETNYGIDNTVHVTLPSMTWLTPADAREFGRALLRVADAAETVMRPNPETVTDKAEILLDVYDSASRSLAGFDPALIDDKLTFQFNGRLETATLVGAQSFCDFDDDNKPRKLTITLAVQP